MAGRRKYDDGCAVAHALDLIGERWALLVVRELLLGPKRFTDLHQGLPGASPDMLTQRLRELAEAGLVRRRRLPAPAASWVYELTGWGRELEPVLLALARWSVRSPTMPVEPPLSVDAAVLSLKTLFDPAAAAGFTARLALRLGEHRFGVYIAHGEITVGRGEPENPDATLETDVATLRALLLRPEQSAAALVATGDLRTDADPALIETLRRLFPAPQPAA